MLAIKVHSIPTAEWIRRSYSSGYSGPLVRRSCAHTFVRSQTHLGMIVGDPYLACFHLPAHRETSLSLLRQPRSDDEEPVDGLMLDLHPVGISVSRSRSKLARAKFRNSDQLVQRFIYNHHQC